MRRNCAPPRTRILLNHPPVRTNVTQRHACVTYQWCPTTRLRHIVMVLATTHRSQQPSRTTPAIPHIHTYQTRAHIRTRTPICTYQTRTRTRTLVCTCQTRTRTRTRTHIHRHTHTHPPTPTYLHTHTTTTTTTTTQIHLYQSCPLMSNGTKRAQSRHTRAPDPAPPS